MKLSKEGVKRYTFSGRAVQSLECRKQFVFVWVVHCYAKWLAYKILASLRYPIRHWSKTKTNRDLLAHIFPRFASARCICFAFWLVHWIIYGLVIGQSDFFWYWLSTTPTMQPTVENWWCLLSFCLHKINLKLNKMEERTIFFFLGAFKRCEPG